MTPEHWTLYDYPNLDIDTQVSLQIALAKKYAQDYLDVALSEQELKEEIAFALYQDLKKHEQDEKYEYCILYKDTIENIEHISIYKLF
jgi:hypothetical protein